MAIWPEITLQNIRLRGSLGGLRHSITAKSGPIGLWQDPQMLQNARKIMHFCWITNIAFSVIQNPPRFLSKIVSLDYRIKKTWKISLTWNVWRAATNRECPLFVWVLHNAAFCNFAILSIFIIHHRTKFRENAPILDNFLGEAAIQGRPSLARVW